MKHVFILLALLVSEMVFSQVINPKEEVKRKSEQRANQKSNETIDKGLDKIEEGINSIFKKKEKKPKKSKSKTSSPSTSSGNYDPIITKTDKEGNTDYSSHKNFEFIPGENVLFFDDFSNGLNQWNKVTWDEWEEKHKGLITTSNVAPGNWYYMPRKGTTQPKGLKTLPNQFTLEYDFFVDNEVSEHEGGIMNIIVKEKGLNINEYSYHFDRSPQIIMDLKPKDDLLYLAAFREYGYTDGIEQSNRIFEEIKENYWRPNQVHRVSLSRNGAHLKIYVNQDLMMDLPNALPLNESYTLLLCNNLWASGYYISNVRVATGFPQPTNEFKSKKTFITQSIHFDVNSDVIKPSSYHVLKEIASSIQNLNGNILIVGHTDNDGSAQHNLELSQKRAASVKRALVNEFGIDATRLTTDGKGLSEPLNRNSNASEKALNRRVEFINL